MLQVLNSSNQVPNKYKNYFKEYTGYHNGIFGRAIFASQKNEKKRYFLEKRWREGDKVFLAFMMNPSKASHNQSDDTIDQLISKAKELDYDALYVINVSPRICGSSNKLRMRDFKFDEINWCFIRHFIKLSSLIFIGWGMLGQKGIKKQLKEKPLIANYLKHHIMKICYYELLISTDKNKYVPRYYVPHPRPIYNKNKYVNSKLISFSDYEFNKLFMY